MSRKAALDYLYWLALGFFLLILLIVGLKDHENIGFDNEESMLYNKGWTLVSDSGSERNVSLPSDIKSDKGRIVLRHVLPEHVKGGLALCVWTENQSLEASVDGETIYEFALDRNKSIFSESPGSCYNVIHIPEDASGRELTLTFDSYYGEKSSYLHNIYIGTQGALFFTMLHNNGFGLLLSILILCMALALAVAYMVAKRQTGSTDTRKTLYLFSFVLMLGVWTFVQSRMGQLLVGNAYALTLIRYDGAVLLPVPVLYYVSMVKKNSFRKPVIIMALLFIVLFLAGSVLQFAGIADLYNMTLVNAVMVAASELLLAADAITEVPVKHNRNFYPSGLAVLFLCLFSGVELALSLIYRHSMEGDYIRIGLALMAAVLVFDDINTTMKRAEKSRNAAYYEKLAMVDIMSGCYSRTAYNARLEEIAQRGVLKDLGIILFDLNFLKRINDNYGHQEGDRAIRTCAACIRRVFDSVGDTYRIGGDEFVVMVENCSEYRLLQRLALLQRLVAEQDKHLDFSLNLASGYAIYDQNLDGSLDDLIHRADASMYRRKKSMKQNAGSVRQ